MSHFYADIQGARGPTSRCGSRSSGIVSHTRGWDSGVKVVAHCSRPLEQDEFDIYMTSGSNGIKDRLIGVVTMTPEGPEFSGGRKVKL